MFEVEPNHRLIFLVSQEDKRFLLSFRVNIYLEFKTTAKKERFFWINVSLPPYLFDLLNGEEFAIFVQLFFDQGLEVADDFAHRVLQLLVHKSLGVGIQPRHLDGVE